ncbi:hypothetical protein [Microbacterium sp. NPDC089695]|uniref:hypothetical protein n=1 Tax=Microbacterium sp. NPDC089695 TaxID=3364198 RepID=UPI003818B57F
MHWDRLFEDLESQLASEWESERAALDAESERLRISRLDLRDRLRILTASGASATVDVAGCGRVRVRLQTLGADWSAMVLTEAEGADRARATRIVPLNAILGLDVDHGLLLASLDTGNADDGLRERMTLGFVLRDLARRRAPVRVLRVEGPDLHGTIDRAGADHLDLAVHDAGSPRSVSGVTGFRIVPFRAIAGVQIVGSHIP